MARLENALMRRPVTKHLLAHAVYAGRGVRCPCCDGSFRRFAPYNGHPNRVCWNCGALERHREVALLLRRQPGLLRPGLRVLHMAPEPPLRGLLTASSPLEYVTADLEDPEVDLNFDLTAVPLPDGSFDVIVCNHVMEHIPDDRRALREIGRLLAVGGWALLMTPILAAETLEDPTVTDPEHRLRLFGQRDHVRRYGWDYLDRIRAAGLSVEVTRLEDHLSPDRIARFQLKNLEGSVEPIILGTKPTSTDPPGAI